jgi:hypothetical protein
MHGYLQPGVEPLSLEAYLPASWSVTSGLPEGSMTTATWRDRDRRTVRRHRCAGLCECLDRVVEALGEPVGLEPLPCCQDQLDFAVTAGAMAPDVLVSLEERSAPTAPR